MLSPRNLLAAARRRLAPPAAPKAETRVGHSFGLQDTRYAIEFERATQDGATFFLPLYGMRRAARTIRAGAPHEPETQRLVRALLAELPGDMIHAGTFFGPMLPAFSRACRGTVYAFEPVLESYLLAKATVQVNALGNVVMFNAALDDAVGIGFIETMMETGQHTAARATVSTAGQRTTMFPIDALGIADLALIQLDVEGHELPALKGAAATIRAQRPVILAEDGGRTAAPWLATLGYRMVGRVPGQKAFATPERADLVARALAAAGAEGATPSAAPPRP